MTSGSTEQRTHGPRTYVILIVVSRSFYGRDVSPTGLRPGGSVRVKCPSCSRTLSLSETDGRVSPSDP